MLQAIAPPPSVTVGGRSFQLRCSNGAFFLLSTMGIDVTNIVGSLNQQFSTGHYHDVRMKIAAALLGNFDRMGQWKSANLSPVELADLMTEEESGKVLDEAWKAFAEKNGLVTKQKEAAPPAESSTKPDGANSGPSEPPQTA